MLLAAVSLVAVMATLISSTSAQQKTENARAGKNETVFSCRLDALTREERERHLALWKRLQASRQEVRELANGYAIGFPGASKTLMEVAEFVSRERRCCPFFTFEIEVGGEDQPLWLRLMGSPGVKEFIKTEIGIR